MLKTNSQPAGAPPDTSVDDSKVVCNSGRNNRKSAKSDFIKPVRRAEESSFLTLDAT